MLPENISRALECTYGPVRAQFTINQTPEGAAPLAIKEQWKGLTLPVRSLNVARFMLGYLGKNYYPIEDYRDALTGESANYNDWPISVQGYDAVDALQEAGRLEAAEFWAPYCEARLVFNHFEGKLVSLEPNSTK